MKGKIYIFITALLIGIVIGYAYRMIQVEPHLEDDLFEIRRLHYMVSKDLSRLDLRLALIEREVKGLQKKKKGGN